MDKLLQEEITKQANALMAAPSCCAEAKAAAEKWLRAVDTPDEKAATENLIKEAELDITSIDGLIGFAESPAGAQVFGAEGAEKMAAHAREIKAQGAKYCDCAACTACAAILNKKDQLLAKTTP